MTKPNPNLEKNLGDAFSVPGASVEQARATLVRAGIDVGAGTDEESDGCLVARGAGDNERGPSGQKGRRSSNTLN